MNEPQRIEDPRDIFVAQLLKATTSELAHLIARGLIFVATNRTMCRLSDNDR